MGPEPLNKYPKELRANAKYRKCVLAAAKRDKLLREGLRRRCQKDILFWVNVFCWTFDPRKTDAGDSPHIPFITWPFQDKVLLRLAAHIGKDDVGIEKSRDMGASWLCLLAFLHQWQFLPGRAFMVVSRNERLVDAPSDPDCLFWKLDYLLKEQPSFLVPRFRRTALHLENLDNGSYIDGASTTADVGRGGRRTAFLVDEYGAFEPADSHAVNAATADNTRSRIFNSTYKGTVGAFYEQMQRPEIVRLSLHWSLHPEKAKGAYKDDAGKWRSEWYAKQCKRIVTPALIAQELDMDPQGAESPFFPCELIDKILQQDVRPPLMRGRLEWGTHLDKPVFVEDRAKGEMLLWQPLTLPNFKAPAGESYVIGCDVATGSGATNSVLTACDRRTREKVAEFASPRISPERFAELAYATARFFNDAQIIWEMNGPGGTFGKRLVDLGYRNIYYRRDEQGLAHKVAQSLTPGWHASPQNKLLVFRHYIQALSSGAFINRSRDAVLECRQYIYLPNGSVGNARALAVTDPSGARQNHGDRPTADALANWLLGPEPVTQQPREEDPFLNPPVNPPYGSLAWRRQKVAEEMRLQQQGHWFSSPEALSGWDETPESLRGWGEESMSGW
jgi:hypothetical protein